MKESYDYAVIRVVPRVDREEFINVGVIVYSRVLRYLDAKVALDEQRLAAFAAIENLDEVNAALAAILDVCAGGEKAGPIGALSQSERFHWVTSPRSTIVQTSPVHSGICSEPALALEHLMKTLVL